MSGGNRHGSVYAADLDASLTADADALWGWHGTSFYLRGFANSGQSIGALTGDALGINNWETGYRAAKLLEAWVDHEFADGRTSLRAGVYDTTTEFDASKTDALFINNASGMNTPLVTSGRNGPSTFATTGLGVRLRYRLSDAWTLKAAVLDGVPGDPNRPTYTIIALRPHDGALLFGELRYHAPDGRRFDIGAWRYTAKFDRLDSPVSGAGVEGFGQQGVYLAGDIMLTHAPDAPLTGLSLGVRLGHSDPRFGRFSDFGSIALTYNAIRPGHPDRIGLALTCVATSPAFRTRSAALDSPVGHRECTVEATYRYVVNNWLNVQPDVQFVSQPIYAPTAGHALALGLRLAVSFDSSHHD